MITFFRLFRMYKKHGYSFGVAYRRAAEGARDYYGDVVGRAI